MHLLKNVAEHCVKFVTGVEDSIKVRKEEKNLRRFKTAWIEDDGVSKLPHAPFALSSDEVLLADKRAESILVPSSFDWRPRPFFSKTTGMKAHEWHQVVTNGILKFCLRDMLAKKQRKTLFKLFDMLTLLYAEEIDLDSIDQIEEDLHKVLALFERDFPLSLQVIVFHLLHHLPIYLKQFGPVYSFWMYPYERFNSWITRRVLNRRYPESTVLETYRLREWATFMEVSKQLPQGACDIDQMVSEGLWPRNEKVNRESCRLTDEQVSKLNATYLCSIPAYKDLFDHYELEQKKAKVHHQMKNF